MEDTLGELGEYNMSSEGKYLNTEYQNFFEKKLSEIDPEISKAIDDELIRQQNHIELIASENIVSQAVLEAHELLVQLCLLYTSPSPRDNR